MPGKRKSSYARGATKRPRIAKRRITKYVRSRRKGAARPMRSLSTGYRGTPNQYRFVRETLPVIVDVGTTDALTGVSVLAAADADDTTMSVIKVPNFKFADVQSPDEFANLFANYKIDKIETFLIPQWEGTVNPDYTTSGPLAIPNLMITRLNTKYLSTGLSISANANAQRVVLSQIVKKTRSLYGSRKWLKLTTANPQVQIDVADGGASTNIGLFNQPWLSLATGQDQQFAENTTFFADRLNGTDMVANIYKYRMYRKVHFRTSFVG